jgi:hypothetical protein
VLLELPLLELWLLLCAVAGRMGDLYIAKWAFVFRCCSRLAWHTRDGGRTDSVQRLHAAAT